ncbi:Vacuolar protein sorting-associated protein [Gracilaria domingensis]|nr:Vacuolar protein sorting-associated protein [Gracilaria domingensis]
MLESVLADVLTRILGQYLEGIDRQSVTFGAWSGLVELRSVALRPEALAVLFETLGVNLPVTVEAGFIGLLRLNVPWNAIGTTPVLITLEDITIIARPVRGDGSDDSELELRERRIKRARLNTDDAVREASWGVSSETESKASSSWSNWLVSDQLRAKVIDNIQLHLKDIIIRFEDPFSDKQRPYLTSVVCESLKIVSANDTWNEAFVERGDDLNTRKLLQVTGFRVDWAPITKHDQPGASLSTDHQSSASARLFQTPELLRQFVRGDSTASSPTSVAAQAESLISSIDGFMRILLSPNNAPTIDGVDLHQLQPAVDLDIRFPNVTCNLNDVQYTSLLQTSVYFARLATRGVRPKTAKARWVWAIDQLLPGFSGRRKRALRLTEAGIAETRTKRIVYAAYRKSLLKARRTGVEEPNEIAEELENIEASSSYEETIAFRDWVDRQIDRDHEEWQAIAKKQEKRESTEESGTSTSTFWRMLGYADEQEDEKKQQSQSSETSTHTTQDDDQKQIVREREIDSILNSGSPQSEQRTSLALRVAFLLQSVTLNLSQGGFPRQSISRLSCTLQNLRVGVLVSSANDLITEAVLGSVEVWDVQKNAPLAYNRIGIPQSQEDYPTDSVQGAYPTDVGDALESIRDGSNPASEILMHQEAYSDQESDTSAAENQCDLQPSPSLTASTTQSASSGSRRKRARAYGAAARDTTPPTFRVTEEEFIGTSRASSSPCRYAAAFRYRKEGRQGGGEDPSAPKTYLDVSIATLEAVVDGPKGSFVWGLKFWRPRGMAEDPIMAFLGAAAGARIAELRMEIEEALVANKVPLQINAVILAPRFIIPGGEPSSPAIVVNMGTIGVCTSDNALSFSSAERQDLARRVRYSNYVMTLDNLSMYFCPSLATALSRSPQTDIGGRKPPELLAGSVVYPTDTSGVERIIRPFSLRFMVQTLRDATMVQVARHSSQDRLSSEDNIAKVRVRGTVPDVTLILTQAAFQHLLITIDKWSRELLPDVREKTGNEDETSIQSWPVSHGPRGHSVHSPSAISSHHHVHEGQKHEVMDKEPLPTALASYDVRLLLNRASVELRDRAEMRLLTLTAYHIQGEVVKTGRANLKACFSLQSWSVTDGSRGSTAAYRRLVYAGNLSGSRAVSPPRSTTGTADSRGQEEDQDFVTVKYDLDFRTRHQRVQVHFLSLNVVCVRETYIRLARYFRAVREYVKANRVKRRIHSNIEPESSQGTEENFRRHDSKIHGQQGHQGESPPLRQTYVVSEFDGLNFQLIASGGVVAVLEMRESKIQYLNEGDTTAKAWGDCRHFSVRDLTSPVREHISEQRIDNHDEWVLSIPRSRIGKFYNVISQYFKVLWKEVEPIVDLVVETETPAHGQTSLANEFRGEQAPNFIVNLVLNDLALRLPRHSACASEALNVGIQDICLSNSAQDGDSNRWSCRLTDAQFAVEYLLLQGNPSSPISVSSSFLTNFMADIVIGTGNETAPEGPLSRREVWFRANRNVFLSLNEAQYTVLYFVLTENLAETVTELDLSLGMDCLKEERGDKLVQAESDGDMPECAAKYTPESRVENTDGLPHLQKPEDTSWETFVGIASFPSFVFEVSRGWDVTRDSCKILGVRLKDFRMLVKIFNPRRLLVELDAKLQALEDLRRESRRLSSEFVVPLVTREGFEPSIGLGKNDMQQNLSMVYDKEGVDRPSIFLALNNVQIDIPLDLFRDLTYLAVPGWPFLESSSFPPDFVYLGRTLNVVMNNSQLLLRTYQHDRDRRALAMVGEFEVKMEWMRNTGAKLISLETRQMEVSCLQEIRPLGEDYDVFGVKTFCAYPIEASRTPLLYPSNFFVEYIGPLADEKGCRLHLSSEALLCLVNASDIPLLRAIGAEISRKPQSYLSRRAWKQASNPPGRASSPVEPKEKQRRMALASMNVSMDIAAVRCLLSDDADGQFIPVLETQISSLLFSSHAGNITQIEGVASMDLFNSEKGWWEPALEPWHLAASISHGQSGAKSYIIRSEKRADFNITPTTVTAVLTVLRTLSTPEISASSSSQRQLQKLFVRESDSSERPAVAAFFVRNELGLPVNVNLPSTSHRITIVHGSEIEVQAQSESLVSSGTERSRMSRESALRCSLTIPSYFSKNLSAAEVGIFPLAFFPTDSSTGEERKKLHVVWEVKMSKGVPLCTLRSQYRVLNHTKRSMEIFVYSGSKDRSETSNAREERIFLGPGEAFHVPVQHRKNEIFVRPVKRTLGEISSVFEWSSPMPSVKWLRRVARDSERNSQRIRNNGGKRKPNINFCRSSKQGWIDVALLAPIVLKNDLPGSLFYKVTQSETMQTAYAGSSYDYEETILAAGKISSLETEHLHFSGESMTPCFLSLAYDNLPGSQKPDESWIPEFGKSVSVPDVENGRVKAVFTGPESRASAARGVKDLRCSISSGESVSGEFTISAGVWERTPSSSAVVRRSKNLMNMSVLKAHIYPFGC